MKFLTHTAMLVFKRSISFMLTYITRKQVKKGNPFNRNASDVLLNA